MAVHLFSVVLRAVAALALAVAGSVASAQTTPAVKTRSATLPTRVLTVELRVGADHAHGADSQRWVTPTDTEEEWQKLSVANGEKARFEFGTAQAWAWTHTAMRGNGAGSVDGVGQTLQWAQDVRALECHVQWAGGYKPARLDVAVQISESGKGAIDGMLPQSRASKVQTVVWAPLGQWVTLARSGPRPAVVTDGSYSSRSAEVAQARVLQVRVLAPD